MNYALNFVRIWPREDTTYHIGSAPYKNVLHMDQEPFLFINPELAREAAHYILHIIL